MKTIQATWRDGAFHPQEPVPLPPGVTVEISIPDSEASKAFKERFGKVIGAFPPDVLDQMEEDIEEAFGKGHRLT